MGVNEVRLQKYISEYGAFSRRAAERLIECKKVKVNGHTAKLGDKVDPYSNVKIIIDGQEFSPIKEKYYIMLNKPRGFVTTMKDERGRKCVADLITHVPCRVYPIGRLDKDSEGLLLFTNDGDFANKIMHPGYKVRKTYRVTVKPTVKEKQLVALSLGMVIEGVMCVPLSVDVIKEATDRTVLEIVLDQGKNREIRKMCETVGLEVIRLKRTRIGNLKLGMLQIGKWRELTKEEKNSLINVRSTL